MVYNCLLLSWATGDKEGLIGFDFFVPGFDDLSGRSVDGRDLLDPYVDLRGLIAERDLDGSGNDSGRRIILNEDDNVVPVILPGFLLFAGIFLERIGVRHEKRGDYLPLDLKRLGSDTLSINDLVVLDDNSRDCSKSCQEGVSLFGRPSA